MPCISIITPTYNRRLQLLRAIASVKAQKFVDFEHIIADDGSTDGTEQAVTQLGDPRIVYLRQPSRSGANAARNAGLSIARASLTTFLDSDDFFLPERLSTTLSIMDLYPDLTVLISSFNTSRSDRIVLNRNPAGYISSELLEKAVIAQLIYMACSSITVRTAALREIGGFDDQLSRFQDGDLLIRLAQKHGAYLSDTVTWVKNTSIDSITTTEPAIPAYAQLCRHNPQYRNKFPKILGYMIARSILTDILSGRPLAAWNGLLASRTEPFSFSIGGLIYNYVCGKHLRSKLRTELVDAAAESGMR